MNFEFFSIAVYNLSIFYYTLITMTLILLYDKPLFENPSQLKAFKFFISDLFPYP